MSDLLNKISSYHIFNYLLPGILFVVIADKFKIYNLIQADIVLGVFVYYFIGLVISRFGSLVIEPILKKVKFLKFAKYEEFLMVSENDSNIEIFSEANNMYRTFSSMFVLILLFKFYEFFVFKFSISKNLNIYILITSLLIMFFWSYRKQTGYITKRIKAKIAK